MAERANKRKPEKGTNAVPGGKKPKAESSAGSGASDANPPVVFSRSDSAPQLTISKDQLTVTGEKGYRMARASLGVTEGAYYWEAAVLPPEAAPPARQPSPTPTPPGGSSSAAPGTGTGGAHLRLGWAQAQAPTQAPVGYDRWSYGYRDVAGAAVHRSLRRDHYGQPYGPGDIIGFLIYLPPKPKSDNPDGSASQSDAAEVAQLPPQKSYIKFFKNGVDQGVAYEDIPEGKYYPAVSLYGGARVRANFGPQWARKPGPAAALPAGGARPLRARAEGEERVDQLKWVYEQRHRHGLISDEKLEEKMLSMVKQRSSARSSKTR